MQVTWLGWAGVEIQAQGERVVVDPLAGARATFAWAGAAARGMPIPELVPPQPGAAAALLTHLHRDHADADALTGALRPGGTVYQPVDARSDRSERLGVLQADREMRDAGLVRESVTEWSTVSAGPFTLTALPAVDGTGDPQISWLIQADGKSVLHLGDTMWHGWWWRIRDRFGAPDLVLAPINGARLSFAHRQPPSPFPGVMDPHQAALAAEQLSAARIVPIHYGGYSLQGVYEPVHDALTQLQAFSNRCTPLEVGESTVV